MEPETQPNSPQPAPVPPPPAAPAVPPPPPPATPPVQGSSAGTGSTGAAAGSGAGTPTPGVAPAAPAQAVTPEQYAQLQRQYQQANEQALLYQQYQHLIPLGYRAYQNQVQGPAQPATPAQPEAPKNPFGLPAFDYSLLNYVRKDQDGTLVAIPGGPPDAAIRVQQYQEQLKQVQQQFWSDPTKFLQPLINEQAKKIAAEVYQQQFGQHQQQQSAQQILDTNKAWLYARDAQGNEVTQYDPASGQHRPQLSEAGRFYAQEIQRAHGLGITNPQTQHEFAIRGLKTALYEAQQRPAQAAAQGQQAAQQFVQGAAQNAAAALPNPGPAGPAPALPPTLTLRERMAQQFNAHGLNDATVMPQVNRAV